MISRLRLHRPSQEGFSLIELMIVLVIIGLLAAIGIPNYLDARSRARQRATVAELRNWAVGLSAYMAERGIVPPAITPGGIPVSVIHNNLVPYAVSALHDQDNWKFDMIVSSNDPASYTVASYGSNGVADFCITPATNQNYQEDIVVSDGIFVCTPS